MIVAAIYQGNAYVWLLNDLEADPVALRVTWYEEWQQINVPVQITTTLGI
ncbi:MAG: hypothetical protein JJ992_21480 [Planctomycetes bacterium]|nr:hypothetical protein [Planctomycetota bacterium]